MGYVREFPDRPTLASAQWAERLPPRSLIHIDNWSKAGTPDDPLVKKIEDPSIWRSIFPEDSPDEPPSRE
jgi:hypothetical protein